MLHYLSNISILWCSYRVILSVQILWSENIIGLRNNCRPCLNFVFQIRLLSGKGLSLDCLKANGRVHGNLSVLLFVLALNYYDGVRFLRGHENVLFAWSKNELLEVEMHWTETHDTAIIWPYKRSFLDNLRIMNIAINYAHHCKNLPYILIWQNGYKAKGHRHATALLHHHGEKKVRYRGVAYCSRDETLVNNDEDKNNASQELKKSAQNFDVTQKKRKEAKNFDVQGNIDASIFEIAFPVSQFWKQHHAYRLSIHSTSNSKNEKLNLRMQTLATLAADPLASLISTAW